MENEKKISKLKKKFTSMHKSLLMMTIFPMLILGIIVAVFVYNRFTDIMYEEVGEELKNTALIIRNTYDYAFPGDYGAVGNDYVAIVKGDKVLNGNYTIIDSVKDDTESEITFFYGNVRILTTILDEKNNRIVGTTARTLVVNQVVKGEDDKFYSNTVINNKKYFSYYMPIYNSNSQCCGMIAVSKPANEVNKKIIQGIFPILLIVLAAMILVAVISYKYSDNLIKRISKVRKFLKKTSGGQFTSEIDEKFFEKNDELSEMGRSALSMQSSLKKLVEQDALTEINNRRYGDKFLLETQKKCINSGIPFSVCIADIDFFKKINDAYGHECGDYVLKVIAAIFKKNMIGRGFVARWGGEEFLLVFDRDDVKSAKKVLDKILDEIRKKDILYNDKIIKITITCGLTDGSDEAVHSIVKRADNRLYEGKQNGRDRIIS